MNAQASNPALDLSRALAAAVEAAGQSVVRIEARPHRPSSGVVWSSDGVIVTADHTVEREEGIEVGLPDGRAVPARLVGRDPGTDLAALRVEAADLAVPDWSDLVDLRVGHLALTLARPGRTVRAALGIVCALGEESWRTPAGGRIDRYLETDVAIQPGFSGGLLADAAGRALGIDTTGLRRRHPLAVPAPTVRRVVESLLAHGSVQRGFLGIGAHPVRLPAPLAEAAGAPIGLIIVAVQPGSAADQAGVLLGDVLVALDGKPVGHLAELHALLGEERVGTEATLRLLRGGEVREVTATLGAR